MKRLNVKTLDIAAYHDMGLLEKHRMLIAEALRLIPRTKIITE
jgi:hypothetical protein